MEAIKLYYHAFIPGRGEYCRLVLEAAGVPYEDVSKTPGGAESQRAVMSALARAELVPHMAPPFLECVVDGRLVSLSQTPLICRFIAERAGLAPADLQEALAAEALALTCLDLANECHNTHHPVASSKYYGEQRAEALTAARDFTAERLPKFCGKIAAAVRAGRKRAGSKAPFAFGAQLSYADLILFHTMKGVEYAFPAAFARVSKDNDQLLDLIRAVEKVPRVKEYLDSPRRMPFNANGVFRFYEELQ